METTPYSPFDSDSDVIDCKKLDCLLTQTSGTILESIDFRKLLDATTENGRFIKLVIPQRILEILFQQFHLQREEFPFTEGFYQGNEDYVILFVEEEEGEEGEVGFYQVSYRGSGNGDTVEADVDRDNYPSFTCNEVQMICTIKALLKITARKLRSYEKTTIIETIEEDPILSVERVYECFIDTDDSRHRINYATRCNGAFFFS